MKTDYRTPEIVEKAFQRAIDNQRIEDMGWMRETLEEVKSGKITPSLALLGLNRREREERLDRFLVGNDLMIENIEHILQAPGHPPRPQQTRIGISAAKIPGIVTFHGPSGTGKTTTAIRAAAYLAARGEETIVGISGSRLGRLAPAELSSLIERCIAADVVILDDLDKGSKSETRSSAILEILDGRERSKTKHTILTINRAGEGLVDQIERQTEGYGLPIVNRMRRGVQVDFEDEEINVEDTHNRIRETLLGRFKGSEEWEFYVSAFGRFA